ncbi:Mov34/MPN/PAD-1 family protein [Candidatus Woesearchaeota archaeon]|nr:Mov34/MPN/PAD-1 family protein [Candidatus Woesearchaeota archaeon]
MTKIVPKAIISEEAFVMMIAGAAEVYDKETYGLLIGKKRKKDYHIEYAVPHQSTLRYKDGVNITIKREKKLIDTINFFRGYRYIGEFHSHPDGPPRLSKQDKKDLRESGAGISIIVVIEDPEEYCPWEYDRKDKCIKGSVSDDFYIKIKAYKCDDNSERILKLRLECDFLKDLNKRIRKRYPSLFEDH